MRKYISIIIAVILLAGSFFIAKKFAQNKKKPKSQTTKLVKTVFTEKVKNKTIPLIISSSGNLVAKKKIDLYAEVQGVLKVTKKDFKAGTNYQKGETIISINSDEQAASLLTLKSNLFNALTAIMPDIKIDFPEEYEKWLTYLSHFEMNKSVADLPQTKSDKEKFFISSRNIFTSYYNYKNLEVRLAKYQLKAPFSGVLTEAMVTQGTLVRVGQKLGEFIQPNSYELEVSINTEYSNLLKLGKTVVLKNIDDTQYWKGTLIRINEKVDAATQTIKVYIQVNGNNLHDGMYLNAELNAKPEENAFELSRNLLVNSNQLYYVKDSVLDLITIKPVYFNKNRVVVKGLPNELIVLTKATPGAYVGMPVKIFTSHSF